MSDAQYSMTEEIWKPVTIPQFAAHYAVSNFGRVRRETTTTATRAGKILKPGDRAGYAAVTLRQKDQYKCVSVHMLVALAFLPRPPGPIGKKSGEYQVDHKNGCRTDNRADNLQWKTNIENMLLASQNGQLAHGARNSHAKLTEEQRQKILDLLRHGVRQKDIAQLFGLHRSTINRITYRKTWRFSP